MSQARGQDLAELQAGLTELWELNGPDHVWDIIRTMPDDTVRELLMVNIGANTR